MKTLRHPTLHRLAVEAMTTYVTEHAVDGQRWEWTPAEAKRCASQLPVYAFPKGKVYDILHQEVDLLLYVRNHFTRDHGCFPSEPEPVLRHAVGRQIREYWDMLPRDPSTPREGR